jgi:hypothetical protein
MPPAVGEILLLGIVAEIGKGSAARLLRDNALMDRAIMISLSGFTPQARENGPRMQYRLTRI